MSKLVANICEKWGMTLEAPAEGDQEWFLDWVIRSPREAGHHLTAGWLAYSSLRSVYDPKDINSAREYFGGMGAQSLMINELFAPADHTVMDYSKQAVEHLARELDFSTPPRCRVGDAYDPSNCFPADLVGLDFGDLTVWKTREGEQHRKLLDRVFAHKPKAVVLTDIACRYLHLHRNRYESLLGPGTCASYDTYLEALVDRLGELYGYVLVAGFKDRWSTVMALAPYGVADQGVIVPTPASPVGLDLF